YRLVLSVNLSTTQLRNASLIDDVAIALSTSHLTPRSLVLEITADEALASESRDALHALTQLGVHVAVDDFDPTSDSLEALAERGISLVKLDRLAVARLGSTNEEEARLHDLLQEARSLGLAIVATGVEDALQRRILQAEHVSSGQGYLFSAPREAHEIDEYLRGFSIFSGDPL
ncbi:MAG: EAL domain-containing protein, partial [Acidobacteriota bacterium]|nr:EAL domain-containing protein [Acidobacteriota bacterium]